MFDIIGDIHGHYQPLVTLLKKLGYQEKNGVYQHPTRQAIFVGDLIDRGPQQVKVYRLVRAMVEHGSAKVVMGNHELNAVLWTIENPKQAQHFLRPHSMANFKQHEAFLNQVVENSDLHKEIIAWFKTLPLWIETNELRVIHACWLPEAIDTLYRLNIIDEDAKIKHLDAWHHVGEKHTDAYQAVETLLKGIEFELPNGLSFLDKDGKKRTQARVKWWLSEEQKHLSQLALAGSLFDGLSEDPILEIPRYHACKPVFIGHYWLKGEPEILSPCVACTDYSVAAPTQYAKLVAYRYQGELQLNNAHFVWVKAHPHLN